jgi:hypothetical protein
MMRVMTYMATRTSAHCHSTIPVNPCDSYASTVLPDTVQAPVDGRECRVNNPASKRKSPGLGQLRRGRRLLFRHANARHWSPSTRTRTAKITTAQAQSTLSAS